MTHKILVKYIYLILIATLPRSSATILGMKETLQTFRTSSCMLTAPLEVKCPEATVIDIISAYYGALAPNSSEERNCLDPVDLSSVTAASVTSTTQRQRTSPYYTLTNDYLDDFGDGYRSNREKKHLKSHRMRHNRRSRWRRKSDDDHFDDNCQGHVEIKDLLESMCRSRQKCLFSLDSEELSTIRICNSTNGDIYSDLRFMEVEFRCGPSTRSQSFLCEGDTFNAECGEGQRMVIFEGYFGLLEKERPPLISLGTLSASTSCERFAKRLYDKRKEVMMMAKYTEASNGSLVDSLGRPAEPWFQLTACRTTPMKGFLMNHCHGRRSCTFDVTKETLWHPDLLRNCKKASNEHFKAQMNHLKVEYTCADRTIFSTVPATLATPAGDSDDRRLSTVPIIIAGSTSPAHDYPHVSLTPKPTTYMWPIRVRTTTSKSTAPAQTVVQSENEITHGGSDSSDDDLEGYSNSPTVATVSMDPDGPVDLAAKSGEESGEVSAIASVGEPVRVQDKDATGQGAMRTSSSLPSFTETSGNTSPSDTGLINCTIPPSTGDVKDANTVTRSLFIIPVNNLLSAYSFVINNLEKFILYFLLAFLASLLAVLILLSCRLYFSKRYILRQREKLLFASPPINVMLNESNDDEDDDGDGGDIDHHQLTPSPDAAYSPHRTHHRFSSPTTVDGNTTIPSSTSLRSDSRHSPGDLVSGRLPGGAPLDNLTHSSPNLTPRPNNPTPNSRSPKFVSPLARVYFEKHCQSRCTSSNRKSNNDSGTSSGPGGDADDEQCSESPVTPHNECDESPNVLIGSYRTNVRDVHSSRDSGNSITVDRESPSSDNHVTLESHLHFADDERYITDSTANDLPSAMTVREEVRESQVVTSVERPSQAFLRTFSRHPQGPATTYTSPFTLHRYTPLTAMPVSSSTITRSPLSSQSCNSETLPFLLSSHYGEAPGAQCPAATAVPSPETITPARRSFCQTYSFVHHPHHLNHHQHQNPDYYAYHQTEM